MQCIKCETPMKFVWSENDRNKSPVDDGGFLEVSFHFGSRHDQMKGWRPIRPRRKADDPPPPEPTTLERLLKCDKIQAYICDNCFEDNPHLFEGYNDDTDYKEKRII